MRVNVVLLSVVPGTSSFFPAAQGLHQTQSNSPPMRAPYTTNQPHLNGVVAVSIDGQIKCAAVLITARLALSVASCFLLPGTLPLSEAQQIACLQGTCEPNTVVSPSSVRLLGGNDARVREVAARVHRIAIRFTQPWAIPICTRALCGEG